MGSVGSLKGTGGERRRVVNGVDCAFEACSRNITVFRDFSKRKSHLHIYTYNSLLGGPGMISIKGLFVSVVL